MEIDITTFVSDSDPFMFSANAAEMGANVGPITWANAKDEASHAPLLTSTAQLDAAREWASEFGAWSDEEIAAWSDDEVNALLTQYISGDLRELEALCTDDSGAIDWTEAECLSERGTIGGNIFCGTDGRIYFYMGS